MTTPSRPHHARRLFFCQLFPFWKSLAGSIAPNAREAPRSLETPPTSRSGEGLHRYPPVGRKRAAVGPIAPPWGSAARPGTYRVYCFTTTTTTATTTPTTTATPTPTATATTTPTPTATDRSQFLKLSDSFVRSLVGWGHLITQIFMRVVLNGFSVHCFSESFST